MSANSGVIDDYSTLIIFIDIDEALNRVVGNKKLLLRLLANFKGREMAEEVIDAVKSGDPEKIAYEAHKMKGVSANLGLKGLESALCAIEECAKAGQDAMELVPAFSAVLEETMRLIRELMENGINA